MSTWVCRHPVLAGIWMRLDLRGALIERLAFLRLEGLLALPPALEPGNGASLNGFCRKNLKAPF
jgi:hypothetical protein